jgi:hypothetical protein
MAPGVVCISIVRILPRADGTIKTPASTFKTSIFHGASVFWVKATDHSKKDLFHVLSI